MMTKFRKAILLLLLADALLWVLLILDLCGIRFPWITAGVTTPMRVVSAVLFTIVLVGLLLRDIKREREADSCPPF